MSKPHFTPFLKLNHLAPFNWAVFVCFIFSLSVTASGFSQQMYFTDPAGRLIVSKFENDSLRLVDSFYLQNNGSIVEIFSIAVLKDTLYFSTLVSQGQTSRIGKWPISGNKEAEFFPTGMVNRISNSMAVSPDGVLYFADYNPFINQERPFWSFDTKTGILKKLGSLPFPPAGDLMFYKGKLLLAAESRFLEVNIDTPELSTTYFQTPDNFFYGLISVPKSCNENRYFGVKGVPEKMVELDLENRRILGSGPYVPFSTYDGASNYDVGIARGPRIDSIRILGLCNPPATTADIEVKISTAEALDIKYILNNTDTSLTGIYQSLVRGTYSLRVLASNGCFADTILNLQPSNLSLNAASKPMSSCIEPDGSLTLNAAGTYAPFQYQFQQNNWSGTSEYKKLSSGPYHVAVRDRIGCEVADTFSVSNIAWAGKIKKLVTSPALCTANNGTLDINVEGVDSVFTSLNGGPPELKSQYTNLGPGVYRLTFYNKNLCGFDTLFRIEQQLTLPPVWSAVATNQLCEINNGAIEIIVDQNLRPNYLSSINGSQPASIWKYASLAPGNYQLVLSDKNGCSWKDSLVIQPYARPKATAVTNIVSPNCDAPLGGRIGIQLNGGWPPYRLVDSLSNTVGSNSVLQSGLKAGSYKYLVFNADGCPEPVINVTVPFSNTGRCDYFYVPTAFTPNGDGLNDRFKPIFSPLFKQVQFQVINRYGQVISRQNDVTAGWDGRYNGQPQPSGTYIWVAFYTDLDGKAKKLGGTFVLVR